MSHHDTIIRLTDITFRRDNRDILSDINLTVDRGDFIAITGPNGGGKTTLLRILLRLVAPTTGKVEYLDGNAPVKGLPIGYLPQKNMVDSRFPITVEELIASGLLGSDKALRERESELTREILDLVGLSDRAAQPIGTLSGGQLQRALLGRALISRPAILVLDEPLSYVDKQFEHYIYSQLERLRHDTTIILVSHEMSVISGMATRHFIVDHTLTECRSHHHSVHYDCDEHSVR
ncbi:MAG: metal ABC transporter ATP-binding protein [Bacteroidales bacterium]|nr:metal ABC transporter ATP-binding protein [Bacteroidales bacterium]